MAIAKESFIDCTGAVTVLLDNRTILQGQIVRDDKERKHGESDESPKIHIELNVDRDPEFVVLRLTCDPSFLTGDAEIEVITPDLFEEGDLVRINVNEIAAIGPSRCCFEGEDHPHPSSIILKKD